MKHFLISGIFILWLSPVIYAQTVGESIPKAINKNEKYLFYLHGGIVTNLGNNGIQKDFPEWGPYEYLNILDSLKERGFNVISERRMPGVDNSIYADKIYRQVDSLFKGGAKPGNIIIVGASAGSDVTITVSAKLKNPEIKYVIMGACWPDTYKDFQTIEIYGRFLSIIETTDPHGSCYKIFENRKHIKSYKEIKLNTGLSHGFLYKGYRFWIDPIVSWFDDENDEM